MEHSPEIPETSPSLQQLFKGVLDEEYSAFFVCNDEYTAGIVELAASDCDFGRGDLLDSVARNAIENIVDGKITTFLYGGIAFMRGTQPDRLDVNTRRINSSIVHWYIRLTRQDIRYLYAQCSSEFIERAYYFSIRSSINNK